MQTGLTGKKVLSGCIEFLDITGNTFTHREALRAAGCEWSPKNQCWSVSSNMLPRLAHLLDNYQELATTNELNTHQLSPTNN